jgi:hypothetical protein
VFSHFCYFYNVSDEHVLKMPIRRFWAMYSAINRIKAENDLRTAKVFMQSQSGSKESVESFVHDLREEMGDVVQIDHSKQRTDFSEYRKLRDLT